MRSIALGSALRKTCAGQREALRPRRSTYLAERMRLDLRKLVLHVVGVHRADLVARGRAEHLDDLDQLVDAGLAGEQRLAQHQLGHHAAGGPHI